MCIAWRLSDSCRKIPIYCGFTAAGEETIGDVPNFYEYKRSVIDNIVSLNARIMFFGMYFAHMFVWESIALIAFRCESCK